MRRAMFLLLLLSGCMVGPDYKAVEVSISDDWNGEKSPLVDAPLEKWWSVFQDDLLEKYIGLSSECNFDIQKAEANILRARAIGQIAGANLFPQVGMDLNGTKTYFSKNGPVFSIGQASGNAADTTSSTTNLPFNVQTPQMQNLFNFLFDANWELDLFGKTRRLKEVAQAEYESVIEEKNDLLITIFSEIAKNYIHLRANQERIDLIQSKIDLLREEKEIVESRVKAGYSNLIELEKVLAKLSSFESELPNVVADVYKAIYTISILIGEPPEVLVDELLEKRALFDAPEKVPLGLRSDLLRRRPDIRYAEKKLKEATAAIGVAVASFFPSISLAATGGLQSLALPQLFEWGSKTWAYGADVNMPIFQGGRLVGNLHVTQNEQAMMAAQYQQVVLNALQSTESSLKEFESKSLSLDFYEKSYEHKEKEVFITHERYIKGLINRIDDINAKLDLNISEMQKLDLKEMKLISLISLYKNLGGGWDFENCVENETLAP